MRFRTLMMIAVTVLDAAFLTTALRGAPVPDFSQVRADFKIGLTGDRAALDRAMKASEQILAQDPKNAQAMVWHGVGLVYEGGELFRKGDPDKGGPLFQQGIKEMNDAEALRPDSPAVLIPRGGALLTATLFMPEGDNTTAMLRSGLDDYLKALDVMKPEMQNIDPAVRGRVLFGVADAYFRLGEKDKALTYFQRTAEEAKGTGYAKQAETYLSTKSLTRGQEMCAGCERLQ